MSQPMEKNCKSVEHRLWSSNAFDEFKLKCLIDEMAQGKAVLM